MIIKLPLSAALKWACQDQRNRRLIAPSGRTYRVSARFLVDKNGLGPVLVTDFTGLWECWDGVIEGDKVNLNRPLQDGANIKLIK